mmetsp:Transcript_16062/g.44419  ORF Transcript_16062/g.44419 Transcript_16062/m.44419 type:complete len:148 (+) Transcript_16062:1279-1722(+)
MYMFGNERVFRVEALPPRPLPISYTVISADGFSWARRRAEAHPEIPPPMMATLTEDGIFDAAAVEIIAINAVRTGDIKRRILTAPWVILVFPIVPYSFFPTLHRRQKERHDEYVITRSLIISEMYIKNSACERVRNYLTGAIVRRTF